MNLFWDGMKWILGTASLAVCFSVQFCLRVCLRTLDGVPQCSRQREFDAESRSHYSAACHAPFLAISSSEINSPRTKSMPYQICVQWRGKSTYMGAIAADQDGLRDSPPLLVRQASAHLKLSKVIIFGSDFIPSWPERSTSFSIFRRLLHNLMPHQVIFRQETMSNANIAGMFRMPGA